MNTRNFGLEHVPYGENRLAILQLQNHLCSFKKSLIRDSTFSIALGIIF